MRASLFMLIVFFISCKDNKNFENSVKNTEINQELYSKLVDYQTKNPIPAKPKNNKSVLYSLIYIYEVKFIKEKEDTIVSITLNLGGINNYYNKNNIKSEVLGIYKDNYLKETYIIDPYKLGSQFINKYLNNVNEINKYYYQKDTIIDAMYDIYLYKIKNGKLEFYKILKGNRRK